MKVSIDLRPAGLPGIGRFATELTAALARRAGDDNVVALRPLRSYGWLGTESRSAMGPAPTPTITVLSPPFGGLDEAELAVRLRAARVDLHHSTHLHVPRLAGIPVVLTVHDLFPLTEPNHARSRTAATYYRMALPWAVKHAAAVVAVSDYTAQQLEEVLKRKPDAVIGHGVDHSAWRTQVDRTDVDRTAGGQAAAPPAEAKRPYLLYVGTAKAHKNLATLLQAHAGGRDRRGEGLPELILAGPTAAELSAAGLQPGPGVTVLGRVPDHQLPSLYAGAAAVAVPSRYEGFGLSALEAMAAGVPVVAADSPGLRDTVGDAGALVPATDPAAWADALSRAAGDPLLRRALIERGRQRAALHRWDDAADAYLALYRKVLDR